MPVQSLNENPEVPLELAMRILDYLRHDFLALKSASLTCHTLRRFCQRILFEDLTLRALRNYCLGDNLHTLLDNSPHILEYIKGVTLIKPSPEINWDEGFPNALTRLAEHGLERLVLEEQTWVSQLRNYLSAEMLDAIVQIIRSPTFRSLTLHGTSIHFLRLCGASLQHVTIISPILKPSLWDEVGKIEVPVKCLDSLSIGGETNRRPAYVDSREYVKFLLDNANGIDLSTISNLYIRVHFVSAEEDFLPLLEKCAPSLRILTIHRQSFDKDICPSIYNLSEARNLRILNTTLLLDRRRRNEHTPDYHIPWLRAVLETLPKPCALETLWIYVGFYGIVPDKLDSEPWLLLDQLLSNQAAFPSLTQVRVDVTRRPDSSTVLHAFYERVRSVLPGLSNARKLDIRKRRYVLTSEDYSPPFFE
ncbi:hypothetical protein BKA70DRAFT_1144144 [Coprinopsis sp. MPI-PUGE-AT-0042]|nr:hypothetical protein BKA70DRAFT_1144144 [Coprinopsis sp. MPI-PUGE-AT-0042]